MPAPTSVAAGTKHRKRGREFNGIEGDKGGASERSGARWKMERREMGREEGEWKRDFGSEGKSGHAKRKRRQCVVMATLVSKGSFVLFMRVCLWRRPSGKEGGGGGCRGSSAFCLLLPPQGGSSVLPACRLLSLGRLSSADHALAF